MKLKELCLNLEAEIQNAYESQVSMEKAERLAAKFLYAQLQVSTELRQASLEARMRKSGVKAVRSAVYLGEIKAVDKKPTEAMLSSIVDTHEVVQAEQNSLDTAEVNKEELERYYDVFGNAHIFFRGVAKANFGG